MAGSLVVRNPRRPQLRDESANTAQTGPIAFFTADDFLFDVAIEMEPEDGLIRVLGLGDESVMAFTDDGVDSLVDLIKIHRETKTLISAPSASPCGLCRTVTFLTRHHSRAVVVPRLVPSPAAGSERGLAPWSWEEIVAHACTNMRAAWAVEVGQAEATRPAPTSVARRRAKRTAIWSLHFEVKGTPGVCPSGVQSSVLRQVPIA